ncbi:Initiator tRNA phosphoribosyl transferase [Moelleriella libera RCEF 2490]|uniref:Initiator tRNA phosphoribosyl transferase n=1 Tax=Moelleriella libera RCEF 2490 TaxID=1081109 RepID=A0A168E278_9HYPO|nr:Initiator tRNA phosphoribosyl transferase [Moelleriella libera RCEF 2490]
MPCASSSSSSPSSPRPGEGLPADDDTILFDEQQQPSLSRVLASLKRANLSVHNRLSSIAADARFVQAVAATVRRPVVANERCGSWYVPPARKDGSAYFKSTDGHERAWKFSTRRLNLHLVAAIEEHDGYVVVLLCVS